jgi:hypothetical protein
MVIHMVTLFEICTAMRFSTSGYLQYHPAHLSSVLPDGRNQSPAIDQSVLDALYSYIFSEGSK